MDGLEIKFPLQRTNTISREPIQLLRLSSDEWVRGYCLRFFNYYHIPSTLQALRLLQ